MKRVLCCAAVLCSTGATAVHAAQTGQGRRSPAIEIRAAWTRCHAAYRRGAVVLTRGMLASSALRDLEALVEKRSCGVAAEAWYVSAEYDRASARHAGLVWTLVRGADAQTADTDPNSPARLG